MSYYINKDKETKVMTFIVALVILTIGFAVYYYAANTSYQTDLKMCTIVNREYHEGYYTNHSENVYRTEYYYKQGRRLSREVYSHTRHYRIWHPPQYLIEAYDGQFLCELDSQRLYNALQVDQRLNLCVTYRLWKNKIVSMTDFEFIEKQ